MWASAAAIAALAAAAASVHEAASVTVAAPVQAAAAPYVQTMIVGRGATLLGVSTVRAQVATVRVGGRRCVVGAGTALAALAAVRRAGGPAFRVLDYGRCGASPADAGQLFVYEVGPDRNSGQDGWVYKVGRRAASTGAGDLSGPFGDGRRLRPGARVLWFWCVMSAGGCQRTLEVVPGARSVSTGAQLTVTVTGYDDNGHGAPIPNATVTLAGARAATATATTAANGTATLTAPATAGRYALSALAAGLAPSFREQVGVG
jgi:hypothetical protein